MLSRNSNRFLNSNGKLTFRLQHTPFSEEIDRVGMLWKASSKPILALGAIKFAGYAGLAFVESL
jgi:hypothetical protein